MWCPLGLKTFHIFFVVVSTVLCVGFGLWSIGNFSAPGGGAASLAMGIGSFVCALVLVCYGFWFLRKLKNVSFL